MREFMYSIECSRSVMGAEKMAAAYTTQKISHTYFPASVKRLLVNKEHGEIVKATGAPELYLSSWARHTSKHIP